MASANIRLLLVLCAVIGASCQIIKSDGRFRCKAEGRFPHPLYSDQYMECVSNDQGKSITAHFYTCQYGIFDSFVNMCIPTSKSYNTPASGNLLVPHSLTRNHTDRSAKCTEADSIKCLNCRSAIVCVNSQPYIHECNIGYTCEQEDSFSSGVCYPVTHNIDTACTCNGINELLPDPYDPSAFLQCYPDDIIPTVYECEEGVIFNANLGTCVYPQKPFKCPSHGNFPDPDDCSKYYKCIQTEDSALVFHEYCECGLTFNDITYQCEDACSFQKKEFICEREGRFPDPYDCKYYYECTKDLTSPGGLQFFKWRFKCPANSNFTATSDHDGHCTFDSVCNIIQVPSCPVPEGRICTNPTPTPGGECILGAPHCLCDASNGRQYCDDGYEGDGWMCNS